MVAVRGRPLVRAAVLAASGEGVRGSLRSDDDPHKALLAVHGEEEARRREALLTKGQACDLIPGWLPDTPPPNRRGGARSSELTAAGRSAPTHHG